MVLSDNRVRQLEAQVAEEKQAVSFRKKVCRSQAFYLTAYVFVILILDDAVNETDSSMKLICLSVVLINQRVEELEVETRRMRRELDKEKVQVEISSIILYLFPQLFSASPDALQAPLSKRSLCS